MTVSGTAISVDPSGDLVMGASTLHIDNTAGNEATSSAGNGGLGELIMNAFHITPPTLSSATASATNLETATSAYSITSSGTGNASSIPFFAGSSPKPHDRMRTWLWIAACWISFATCLIL